MCVTADVTPTHATDRKVEGHGCKLYVANLFLLPELFNDPKERKKKERKEEIVVWPSDVKDRNATEICLLTYSFD
jgi:hypothetical protein